MNTDMLQEGMIFKNYYKLCEALEIKPSTNRQVQLNMIGRYIKVDKINNTQGYIVREIYNIPKPQKTRGRKKKYVPKTIKAPGYYFKTHGNNKYSEFEKKILLKEISIQDKGYLICDRRDLLYILGMCNKEYMENGYKIDNISEYSYGLKYFDYNFTSLMSALIQGMLNSISKTNHLVGIADTVSYCTENNTVYILADDNEYEIFLNIVNSELHRFNFTEYKELYHPKQDKVDIARLCLTSIKERLKTELGWKSYSRKIKLTLNSDIKPEELKIISEFDIQNCQQRLNELIIQRTKEYMEKKGQKLFNYNPNESDPIVIGNKDYGVCRKSYEQYCEDLEQIIDRYIRI